MSVGFSPASSRAIFMQRDGAAAFGMRVGDAEGVGRGAVAEHFAVDRRAACFGVFEFFEDDHRGAFAEHEAVAVEVERPRGLVAARRCWSRGR